MLNNIKTIIIAAIICILLCLTIVLQYKRISSLKEDLSISQNNVKVLNGKQKVYYINDTTKVTQVQALQYDNSELKKYCAQQAKLIKQLQGNKKSKVEYITRVAKSDTFYLPVDTVYMDSCKDYADKYINVNICDGLITATVSDTITQVISKHYAHKFLWWKWKIDGINQDIMSTNPHSSIVFDKFVKVDN